MKRRRLNIESEIEHWGGESWKSRVKIENRRWKLKIEGVKVENQRGENWFRFAIPAEATRGQTWRGRGVKCENRRGGEWKSKGWRLKIKKSRVEIENRTWKLKIEEVKIENLWKSTENRRKSTKIYGKTTRIYEHLWKSKNIKENQRTSSENRWNSNPASLIFIDVLWFSQMFARFSIFTSSIFNCHVRFSIFTSSIFNFHIRFSIFTFNFQFSQSIFKFHVRFSMSTPFDLHLLTIDFQSPLSISTFNFHVQLF